VPFYKKRLRLPARDYIGRRIYFITVGTENRAAYFADIPTGRWLLQKLVALAVEFNFSLHAYCVMPDHLHFLAEGLSDACNLVKFVNAFKQRTAHEFSKSRNIRLWQRRYYDHVLRPREAVEGPAAYIWWNPVRKALCSQPREYPLSGSQTIDWMKNSAAPPNWKPPWTVAAGL
jgi:REP element-mobilizing transposase RayT